MTQTALLPGSHGSLFHDKVGRPGGRTCGFVGSHFSRLTFKGYTYTKKQWSGYTKQTDTASGTAGICPFDLNLICSLLKALTVV